MLHLYAQLLGLALGMIALAGPLPLARDFATHVRQVFAASQRYDIARTLQITEAQLRGQDHLSLSALTQLPQEMFEEVLQWPR